MTKFNALLWVIGLLLWVSSRLSHRVQSQLSRDMKLSIGSEDGIWRTYEFAGRRATSHSGAATDALLTLRFRTGDIGFRILLATDTINQLLEGFGSRDVDCRGEAAVVLWFYELVMGLKPWRQHSMEEWPDSYTQPNNAFKGSDRIIREPAAEYLDPDWLEAHEQREKTLIWQVGRGAMPAGKFRQHRIVIDLDPEQDTIIS